VTVNSGGTLGGTGMVAGVVIVNAGGSIEAGTSAGTLALVNGLNLSAGGTNVWELAANSTASSFDQIILTGGNLVLDGAARVRVKFTGAATFPSAGNAFWQSARSWKIISITGTAANPGLSNFIAVEGAEGNDAGTFSTSVDANGVYLNFIPGATPPSPVISSQIVGAGTTSAQLTWSSVNGVTYQVQYKTNLNQAVWQVLSNITATGSSTTVVDNNNPVPKERYYRILAQ
jgi:fibronectin-binding autotransporter adhesin